MDSIIFDLDGTLWDSTAIVARAWTEYLTRTEHMDILITEERLKSLFGRPMPQIAEMVFPDQSPAEQLRLLDGCCQAEHQALFEDLENTLQSLSQKFPLYIVSNCQAGYIEVFLKSSRFEKYFAGHLCHGDTGADKPETLSLLIKKEGLSSPVYVGDSVADFLSSRKAKVPFVFASYAFGDVPEPDYRIDRPAVLVRLFL